MIDAKEADTMRELIHDVLDDYIWNDGMTVAQIVELAKRRKLHRDSLESDR